MASNNVQNDLAALLLNNALHNVCLHSSIKSDCFSGGTALRSEERRVGK